MAAEHYEGHLTGIGYAGTLGNVVLKSHLIYTFAGGDTKNNFLNFIVNIDYSWEWLKRNFYGSQCFLINSDNYSANQSLSLSLTLIIKLNNNILNHYIEYCVMNYSSNQITGKENAIE